MKVNLKLVECVAGCMLIRAAIKGEMLYREQSSFVLHKRPVTVSAKVMSAFHEGLCPLELGWTVRGSYAGGVKIFRRPVLGPT